MRLVEKYRPKRFADLIGQTKAIAQIQALVRRGVGGRALLFEGPSGVGKTTTALALARALAIIGDEDTLPRIQMGTNLDRRSYEASTVDQKAVEEMRDYLSYHAFGGGMRMIIIDEAQTITAGARSALLSVLESLPENVVLVLTTTEAQALQDDLFGRQTPFGSRCIPVAFELPNNREIAMHLAEIAFAETGDGAAIPYAEIVRRCKGNLRTCISDARRFPGRERSDPVVKNMTLEEIRAIARQAVGGGPQVHVSPGAASAPVRRAPPTRSSTRCSTSSPPRSTPPRFFTLRLDDFCLPEKKSVCAEALILVQPRTRPLGRPPVGPPRGAALLGLVDHDRAAAEGRRGIERIVAVVQPKAVVVNDKLGVVKLLPDLDPEAIHVKRVRGVHARIDRRQHELERPRPVDRPDALVPGLGAGNDQPVVAAAVEVQIARLELEFGLPGRHGRAFLVLGDEAEVGPAGEQLWL